MEQHYKNHSRYVPAYHFVSSLLLLVITIGAIRNLWQSFDDEHRLYNASLILALTVLMWLVWWYVRAFPVKVQDRVILLEEKLRHQQLTGRPLDSRLRPSQIIALRFAPDAEFPQLAEKAAADNMSVKDIKLSIKQWRGDHHRV